MYSPCPIYDQRTQVGSDGRTPEDGNMDCVPTALASMAAALLGVAQNADAYHDAVYGQGYVGMQDPAAYVPFLASKGLTLTAYSGTPAALVAHAVACIRAHQPALLSIPSDWDANPPTSGNAHMVAGCDVDSSRGPLPYQTTLTAMNPWGVVGNGYSHADYQSETLSWWADRLGRCAYKALWVMTREGTSMVIPNGWQDDGRTLTAPNGQRVVRGFRDHILAAPSWPAALVPLAVEYPGDPGVRQDFALRLEWSAANNSVAEVAGQAPTVAPAADPKGAAALAALQQLKSALGEV